MSEILSDFIRRFAAENQQATEFPVDVVHRFIAQFVLSKDFDNKKSAKDLCTNLADQYKDIWYYTITLLRNISIIASSPKAEIPSRDNHLLRLSDIAETNGISSTTIMRRVFLILDQIKRPTNQFLELPNILPSITGADKKLSHYRLGFKNCWIDFLRSSTNLLDREYLIKLLRIIPDTVMPHISDPEIFCSFFAHCFEQKKDLEVSLLSISGLFLLISRFNLGEPTDLYNRVYQLISPQIMSNNRSASRVFQMLVKALRSPLMPAQYIPVFAKRLIRTAVLVSNPSLTLWLVVATFNLMQSNPIVSRILIHRDEDSQPVALKDAFDMNIEDIEEAQKHVHETSLWELELLFNHSDPSVVRMATLFKTNFFSKKAKRISSDNYLFITEEQLLQREMKFGRHTNKSNSRNKGEVELDRMIGQDAPSAQEVIIPLRPLISDVLSCGIKRTKLDDMFLSNLA